MKTASFARFSPARLLPMAALGWLLLTAGIVATHAGDTDVGKNPAPQDNRPGRAEQKPDNAVHDDDLVITPGGPVRKENVHPVGPNEAVRREKDGTLVIVPRTDNTDQK